MKPQRVISVTTGWEYFAKDYLWTVFPGVLLWNPEAYSKEVGECQKVSFLRSQINHVFFSKCFSKHSVKTRWWRFFCSAWCRLLFKNASELSWGKVLLIRVWYREQITRHCWSVTLTYCYLQALGLSAFSNRHAVLRNYKEIANSCEYEFNVKIWKLWKTWKYQNLTIKNSKCRNYT